MLYDIRQKKMVLTLIVWHLMFSTFLLEFHRMTSGGSLLSLSLMCIPSYHQLIGVYYMCVPFFYKSHNANYMYTPSETATILRIWCHCDSFIHSHTSLFDEGWKIQISWLLIFISVWIWRKSVLIERGRYNCLQNTSSKTLITVNGTLLTTVTQYNQLIRIQSWKRIICRRYLSKNETRKLQLIIITLHMHKQREREVGKTHTNVYRRSLRQMKMINLMRIMKPMSPYHQTLFLMKWMGFW